MPCLNLLLDHNNLLLDYNNLLQDYNNLLQDYNNPIIIYYYYNPQININPSCPVVCTNQLTVLRVSVLDVDQISSVAGISKILCTSLVACATRAYVRMLHIYGTTLKRGVKVGQSPAFQG